MGSLFCLFFCVIRKIAVETLVSLRESFGRHRNYLSLSSPRIFTNCPSSLAHAVIKHFTPGDGCQAAAIIIPAQPGYAHRIALSGKETNCFIYEPVLDRAIRKRARDALTFHSTPLPCFIPLDIVFKLHNAVKC